MADDWEIENERDLEDLGFIKEYYYLAVCL